MLLRLGRQAEAVSFLRFPGEPTEGARAVGATTAIEGLAPPACAGIYYGAAKICRLAAFRAAMSIVFSMSYPVDTFGILFSLA